MISGAFSLVNVLADMAGPGTIGISGHNPHFFIVSGSSRICLLSLPFSDNTLSYMFLHEP